MGNKDNKKGNQKFKYSKGTKNSNAIIKKSIEDYNFYLGSNNRPLDYEEPKDYIINHIKKTYTFKNDITESLRSETKIDTLTQRLILKVSTKTDADKKAL